MASDILERAKKALIDDDMTYEDYDECISLLIAEVKAKRNLALDMLTKNKDLLDRAMRAEAEVERLQDKHARVIKKIRAYIIKDAIAVCDAFDWRDEEIRRQREEIDAKDARIKELEARCQKAESRIKELEALNESLIENGNDLRARCWKAEARIKKPEAKNARLDAAFLRSNAAMRYYQEGNRGPWPQLGEKFKEPYQEKAREALKRIKEGGKDE